MTTVYSRLQDLRFLMQDILAGREPLPSPSQTDEMREEVEEIVRCLNRAASTDCTRTGKVISANIISKRIFSVPTGRVSLLFWS